MNCTDANNETPLFYAVKKSSLQNISILKDHGADFNYANSSKGNKTPLFYARNYKTTWLLLKYGADETKCANIEKYCKSKSMIRTHNDVLTVKTQTALEFLVENNDEAAKAILDAHMDWVNEENLILDFNVFKRENVIHQAHEMEPFIVATRKSPFASVNMEESKDLPLLLHPVLQAFLNLKWRTVRMAITFWFVFQFLCILAFTIGPIQYAYYSQCIIRQERNYTNATNGKDLCFENKEYIHLNSGFMETYSEKKYKDLEALPKLPRYSLQY